MSGESLRYRTRVMMPEGPPATHGSRTMTIHPEEVAEQGVGGEGSSSNAEEPIISGTLKLCGGNENRNVQWEDDVVDNEKLGKKKSKVCCIYHKPRAFDESSSESSSSDSSEDEEGSNHNHHHHHHRSNKRSSRDRSDSPNAYERQPQYKSRPQPDNLTS
ncbi:9901_t:CDS:2 [Ambispora gerdemannii]|uniref:Type 1 phosphatases regulator n=1 Tax=Ambispora gerdemannii TaxID=144530 RepID=A0A9N9AEC2_9GLOM|nr:9901_t:CDS:2 [Ambispora gerdemannii]